MPPVMVAKRVASGGELLANYHWDPQEAGYNPLEWDVSEVGKVPPRLVWQ